MKHLIDIYKENQEHDDGSIGHQVIMAVAKDNYLAICDNEIKRLEGEIKRIRTREEDPWGFYIGCDKEDASHNKAIQEQITYWMEQRALIVKE